MSEWSVIDYVTEEVSRQGHDVHTLDGIERVGWMLNAWADAINSSFRKPEYADAIRLGQAIVKLSRETGRLYLSILEGEKR